MQKGGEDYEEKAKQDSKKRKFMNQIRPPHYWNFFEDGPKQDRVSHILRHNAKPQECYTDQRIEGIMTAIEEIGMNLMRYEEAKWNTLKKHSLEIFTHEYNEFKTKLDQA